MKIQNITIRETNKEDYNDIYYIEEVAFGKKKEADLTIGLLNDPTSEPLLSLLAFHEDKPVGHILFTRVYIEGCSDEAIFHILAPLAIVPEYQKKGIGGALIKRGHEILKQQGTELVFVLGHMDYYPRLGYIPDAKKLGFLTPYPIPEEFKNAFMVIELVDGAIEKYNGKFRCADELNREDHWRE